MFELPAAENNLFTSDTLKLFISTKVDRRFEELRSNRQSIEKKWVEKIKSVSEGSAPPDKSSNLLEIFNNLGDLTLPGLTRKLHSRECAWLDTDFFRWKPSGIESTDTNGAYWITDWQRQNLNNELSQFSTTMRAAIWQREILNISAINYAWEIIPKHEYKYNSTTQDGMLEVGSIEKQIKPLEFDLQGLKYEFVSMFSLYPDTVGQTTYEDTNLLDLYYTTKKTLIQIKDNPLYNPTSPYTFKSNVLFRSNTGLEVFENKSAEYSQSEMSLNPSLRNQDSSSGRSTEQKKMIDIRHVFLKEIKLEGMKEAQNAEGRGYHLVYAKAGSEFIPLFLESNPFPFYQKTLRLSRRYIDPYNLYNDSEVGLAINQHFYLVSLKRQQATALIKATRPHIGINTAVLEAISAASKGGIQQTLKELATQTGNVYTINMKELEEAVQAGTPLDSILKFTTLGSQTIDVQNMQLFEQGIQQAKADLQTINTQVTQESGAGATAQYNKQVAQELDLITREHKYSICHDWLKPSLEYAYELAKCILQQQQIITDMNEDDQKMLIEQAGEGIEYKDIKAESRRNGQTLALPSQIGKETAQIQYNPVLDKKSTTLTAAFFQNTKAILNLEFEQNEYSKPAELAEAVQLFGNIVQNMPDSPAKLLVIKLSIERVLQLTNDPNYQQIKDELDRAFEQAMNPPPPQPDPVQQEAVALQGEKAKAEVRKTHADATLKESQAAEEMSRAEEKSMSNAINNQVINNQNPLT